jgi:hypothetical protein
VVVVVNIDQTIGHCLLMVVVNVTDHSDRMLGLLRFLSRFFQGLTNQVPYGLRTIFVADMLNEMVKVSGQVIVKRNSKSFQIDLRLSKNFIALK